ncbi:hypothetical protein [Methylobacterium sp. Leaf91]|uniref:hypothetical protein n=1 Tax=Methylobacterium sp. Leaf91 TaxID=1736247 RepID=UPI0012E773C5|nr:hypothetical protein [Methylobacterium sp. Leaf91]
MAFQPQEPLPVYLPDPKPSADVTPTGLAPLISQNGKLKGSDGDDVVTLFDLQKDNDQVIQTGLGNDIFRWNGDAGKKAGADGGSADINGIIKFGGATDGQPDLDVVYLAFQPQDFEFTLRSDGGIKVHYNGTSDGAAVSFVGADRFVFRNIDDDTGTNYQNIQISYGDLVTQIQTHNSDFSAFII